MLRDRGTRDRLRVILERAGPEAFLDAVFAVSAAPGECRIKDGTHDDKDFPDVRPVLTAQGLQWCCTYNKHCSKAAPLA